MKKETKKALENLEKPKKINNKAKLKLAINKLGNIYNEILPILTNHLKTIKNENLLQ